MNDADCVAFLQWALPKLGLHWSGFRKVRRQVCKRLKRRIQELRLSNYADYRARLEGDASEWRFVDESCHVTISRFFRDKGLFEVLRSRVLREIAARSRREGRRARIWSAGCASGEEAYTLKILWDLEVAPSLPGVSLKIVATDADETMLARARKGRFEATSLRELPAPLIEQAFRREGPLFYVNPRHRDGIVFRCQDLRSQTPKCRFDLILCRYVAFTYFAIPLQIQVVNRLTARLLPDGFLVIGSHEKLPNGGAALAPLTGAKQIFMKKADVSALTPNPAP
jgi:chemotaxis protein methyltransferase CheR